MPSPVALCPKVKEGLDASAGVVSLFSADLPKVNAGGGCAAGALGLSKETPPEAAAADAASPSLLTAPKRMDASFFSSGFPKLNVGAAGSLSACIDPNTEPPCGVVVAKLGPPNLPNTDPVLADVAVVVELMLIDMGSFDDVTLPLLS